MFIEKEAKEEGVDTVDSNSTYTEHTSDREFVDDRNSSDLTEVTDNQPEIEEPVPIHQKVKQLNPLVKKGLMAYAYSGNQECALEVERAFPNLINL